MNYMPLVEVFKSPCNVNELVESSSDESKGVEQRMGAGLPDRI